MSMERERAIVYGFVGPEEAEGLAITEAPKGVTPRIFEPDEDDQFRNGIVMQRKKQNRNLNDKNRLEQAFQEVDTVIGEAREEGKVPVRVTGPEKGVAELLEKAGISVELIK